MEQFLKLLFGTFAKVVVLFAIFSTPVFSSEPFYVDTRAVEHKVHGTIAFKIIAGVSGIGSSPHQGVVVNAKGEMLAATQSAWALSIRCEVQNSENHCVFYDYLNFEVYQPTDAAWQLGVVLEENGQLSLAQKHWQQIWDESYPAYGFQERVVTLREVLKFEIWDRIVSPASLMLLFLSIAWWFCFWFPMATAFWRLKAKNRGLFPIKFRSVVLVLLWFFYIGFMAFVAGVIWVLMPYSLHYLVFVLVTGAASCLWWTHPQRNGLKKIEAILFWH